MRYRGRKALLYVLLEHKSSPHRFTLPTSIVRLLRMLSLGQHEPTVHPASLQEVKGDKDQARSTMRTTLLGKYALLPQPPALNSRLTSILGIPTPGTHDAIDLLILSAVDADAVDFLVTEDNGIHRRARRAALERRVLTIADAIQLVSDLFPSLPTAPPHVTATLAHGLKSEDPIFASFRDDYPDFDGWLSKCKRQHRQAWVIRANEGYAGLCIVNHEKPAPYERSEPRHSSFQCRHPPRNYGSALGWWVALPERIFFRYFADRTTGVAYIVRRVWVCLYGATANAALSVELRAIG